MFCAGEMVAVSLQLRTSLQPRNVRQEQEDMRPLATREQVEDVVGGWESSDLQKKSFLDSASVDGDMDLG